MSKVDDMARGRMEGLVYAERIVAKDGIEGLREEIKKRGCSGMSINVSHKEMEKATSQMRNMMLDTVMAMSMGILHDKFGFGHERLKRFMDSFSEGAELLNDGVITWQQIIDNTEEVTGIRYDKDKVMSSPEDQLSKICAEINEIEVKMADIAYRKAQRIVEVEKVISKLSEEEYKTVLTLCYIDHMAISDIADKLGYSSDWVYKKRRKATDELERYI